MGIKICHDLLNDYGAHKLSAAEFVRQFHAAARGEDVYLSKFVRPWDERPPANQWAAIRTAIFERDNFTCQYCGTRGGKLECDHVMPISRGGTSEPENLKTACFGCNRSKCDKTIEEWRSAR